MKWLNISITKTKGIDGLRYWSDCFMFPIDRDEADSSSAGFTVTFKMNSGKMTILIVELNWEYNMETITKEWENYIPIYWRESAISVWFSFLKFRIIAYILLHNLWLNNLVDPSVLISQYNYTSYTESITWQCLLLLFPYPFTWPSPQILLLKFDIVWELLTLEVYNFPAVLTT